MMLYHGSNTKIEQIDLALSKVGKDFGCGFYLSANKDQAFELATRKTEHVPRSITTTLSLARLPMIRLVIRYVVTPRG